MQWRAKPGDPAPARIFRGLRPCDDRRAIGGKPPKEEHSIAALTRDT